MLEAAGHRDGTHAERQPVGGFGAHVLTEEVAEVRVDQDTHLEDGADVPLRPLQAALRVLYAVVRPSTKRHHRGECEKLGHEWVCTDRRAHQAHDEEPKHGSAHEELVALAVHLCTQIALECRLLAPQAQSAHRDLAGRYGRYSSHGCRQLLLVDEWPGRIVSQRCATLEWRHHLVLHGHSGAVRAAIRAIIFADARVDAGPGGRGRIGTSTLDGRRHCRRCSEGVDACDPAGVWVVLRAGWQS
mmetsp:Transcript_19600/g.49975  ORF Transcript_19600/g.49975 Transcript_19600/m.49975 type:complete len:244 (+) Transcript_19600:1465-2196(+)